MTYSPVPRLSLESLTLRAQARWAAAEVRRPDLKPPFQVQRRVLPVVLELVDGFAKSRLPKLSLPPRYLAAKLDRGVPVLTAEPIPIPVPLLRPQAVRIARELAAAGAGPAAERVAAAILDGSLDAGTLLTDALARAPDAVRAEAERRRLVPELVWLVAEMVVGPFAWVLQESLLGAATDAALCGSRDRWTRGYCPSCGTWPAFVEQIGDRWFARCAFCGLGWDLPAGSCPFCGTAARRGPLLVAADDHHQRAVGCDGCRSYLKIVDVAALEPFPLTAITDIDTMPLDMTAMERGNSRPALHEYRQSQV